jgi:hypothetical protein
MSRIQYIERDYSGFTNANISETGAMVLRSAKGKSTPMFLQSEEDCLRELGLPSATYPGVFEAIAFTRTAPLWVACAIGANAEYGGIDVTLNSVTGFGVGRTYSTFNYGVIAKGATLTSSACDGTTATFTGTISDVPIVEPEDFIVKVNGVTKDVTMAVGGALSGTDITAGSVDLATGDYTITFAGVVGTVATVTTNVDGSSDYDLSSGSVDKYVRITIDGTTKEVNLGQAVATTRADVITAINTAFGFTAAATEGTDYITISGRRGTTAASILITNPIIASDSALTLVFSNTGADLTDTGSNPTLAIPLYGQSFTFDYRYSVDGTATISHSFFTTSPYADDLAASVTYLSGYKFRLAIYKVTANGNVPLNTYDYSLIAEKDAFGKSLLYSDVFNDNPYVLFKLNSAFTGTSYILPGTSIVAFSGGSRGEAPLSANYTTAWNYFQYGNKYKAQIFMDVYGTHATTLNTLCSTYQPWAQAISCIPMGYTASEAIVYRSSLGIDSDDIALYHNWAKIEDIYNSSAAWISNVGSVGRKYALMADAYDAASPAGVDENNHGGLLSDWRVLEVELDYTQAELDSYYNAQINPIVFDDAYGLMAYGDNTLQVTTSDTSFIGTRRVYKYIVDVVSNRILRKQEFKLNDPIHRLMAKTQVEEFLAPIIGNGWIREALVVCDATNNTDAVLNSRTFILDLLVKIQPNSQFIKLRLTRLGQSTSVTDITG